MPFRASPFLLSRPFAFAVALAAFGATGCTPKIGDKCVLSTDCSTQGNIQCDTSMPGGYCTIFNCAPNTCPDYAACYLFHPEVQGCSYNDRVPSRTGESFCMEGCTTDGDCRTGYECVDARLPPWGALLLDDNQNQKVCLPNPDSAFGQSYSSEADDPDAAVCQAYPEVDAAFPPLPDAAALSSLEDAGPEDAGPDAATRLPPGEGGVPIADAGPDATLSDGGATDAASE
jgi:hypothetical protein